MADRERRVVSGTVQTRAAAGEPSRLAGYAAVFNSETVIGSWFREVILPGAFTEAILRDDVRAQFNHGEGGVLPLGRTSAGTLRLSEDETGLRYEVDLPDTQQARDLYVSVQRGDVAESSFMFEIERDEDQEWDSSETKVGKLPIRRIKRVKLYDVSPVTFPAYDATSVSARAKTLAEAVAAVRPPAPPVPDLREHYVALVALDEVD